MVRVHRVINTEPVIALATVDWHLRIGLVELLAMPILFRLLLASSGKVASNCAFRANGWLVELMNRCLVCRMRPILPE
ncbi:MAG TPA: hypothetical protein VFS39_03260, partial [Nitrospira sp.]|nr:hypothetical protein [Nitrospira sp.]